MPAKAAGVLKNCKEQALRSFLRTASAPGGAQPVQQEWGLMPIESPLVKRRKGGEPLFLRGPEGNEGFGPHRPGAGGRSLDQAAGPGVPGEAVAAVPVVVGAIEMVHPHVDPRLPARAPDRQFQGLDVQRAHIVIAVAYIETLQ